MYYITLCIIAILYNIWYHMILYEILVILLWHPSSPVKPIIGTRAELSEHSPHTTYLENKRSITECYSKPPPYPQCLQWCFGLINILCSEGFSKTKQTWICVHSSCRRFDLHQAPTCPRGVQGWQEPWELEKKPHEMELLTHIPMVGSYKYYRDGILRLCECF